jgi:ribosomal protein L37AE/L43A
VQSGAPRSARKPVCHKCGASLGTGPKTIIQGLWTCAKCTYEHDYPERQPGLAKRPRPVPIQEETLFPLPPKRHD